MPLESIVWCSLSGFASMPGILPGPGARPTVTYSHGCNQKERCGEERRTKATGSSRSDHDVQLTPGRVRNGLDTSTQTMAVHGLLVLPPCRKVSRRGEPKAAQLPPVKRVPRVANTAKKCERRGRPRRIPGQGRNLLAAWLASHMCA